MRRWLVPFWVLGLLLALPAGAGAGSVTIEVSTSAGVRLGRLVGEQQAGATYYLLADVARLAGASTRRGSRGDRMSLVSRHGVVQVARDARRITVDGRPVSLAAPVRVRQGTWRVPGDLLARALPTLIGQGVRVAATDAREARGIPPGSEKPVVRPAVAAPPPALAVPAVAAPRPGEARPPRPRRPRRRRARSSPRGPSRIRPSPPRALRAGPLRASSSASGRTRPTRGWFSRRTRRSSPGSSRPRAAA